MKNRVSLRRLKTKGMQQINRRNKKGKKRQRLVIVGRRTGDFDIKLLRRKQELHRKYYIYH